MTAVRVGAHEVRFEEDVAFVTYCCDPRPDDVSQICELLKQQHTENDHLIIIHNISQADTVSAEGRRRMAKFLGSVNAEEIFYGVTWLKRTFIIMVHRVSELTSGRRRKAHVVKSEAEARALIPDIRIRLRTSKQS